jgi:uncharacterized protein YdaU (DUF1376 family)
MPKKVLDVAERDSPLWAKFQAAAKKRRHDPIRLLTEYMEQCLETWEDQRLDEEIRRDARQSGTREADAVEIVRQYRRDKRSRGAAS